MPGNVIDEMDTFNSIWSAVIEDSDMVIDFFQDEDITEPFIFWLTMNNINCYYQVMATAMNNYASGVAASAPDLPRA
ncbi:hypothetical protein BT96DRAFT_923820 [Gymnopus androsaceus JB14]|uniref:Uncharacterized protein n=1 Tax=Gymnopus androsaceus JB14 TaxID=1447944 RepID=A0A6A4H861_9AGAR|nr:hypothetical protein BT96DRAFT_923820 [Gymnopus androsaceus JB14]